MKENKTENLLWIIFTIIGGIFVVIGLIIVGNVFNYENKESTVGIITEISTYRGNNDDRNYRVYVSYNVDGRTYESELNGYSSSFYEGKKINIYYDKNNPNKIGMKSLDFIFLMFPVLRKISVALKLSPKASGNIAGFATSVPEFLTVSFSAASGLIGTSVYNILSSNIINLIQYIFAIYLNKNQKFLRNRAILIDIFLVIATIIIPLVLAIFNVTLGITSVVIFLILLVVFYYINHNVHKIYLEKEDEKIKKEELEEEIEEEKKIKRNNLIFYWIALLIIAWLLYFVGELLSNSLTNLCNTFGLPELVLGILLGFITSIPELITFIEAQRKEKKKNTEMANKIGVIEATNNLLTSNLLNLFVIQSIGTIIYTIIR